MLPKLKMVWQGQTVVISKLVTESCTKHSEQENLMRGISGFMPNQSALLQYLPSSVDTEGFTTSYYERQSSRSLFGSEMFHSDHDASVLNTAGLTTIYYERHSSRSLFQSEISHSDHDASFLTTGDPEVPEVPCGDTVVAVASRAEPCGRVRRVSFFDSVKNHSSENVPTEQALPDEATEEKGEKNVDERKVVLVGSLSIVPENGPQSPDLTDVPIPIDKEVMADGNNVLRLENATERPEVAEDLVNLEEATRAASEDPPLLQQAPTSPRAEQIPVESDKEKMSAGSNLPSLKDAHDASTKSILPMEETVGTGKAASTAPEQAGTGKEAATVPEQAGPRCHPNHCHRRPIEISDNEAPSRRLVLCMIDLNEVLSHINQRVLSGLVVSHEDWETLQRYSIDLGITFEDEVRFQWKQKDDII